MLAPIVLNVAAKKAPEIKYQNAKVPSEYSFYYPIAIIPSEYFFYYPIAIIQPQIR
jgi:hypothetical protein